MAKKNYSTRVVIEGLDRLLKLDEKIEKEINEIAVPKAFQQIEPIMLQSVKERIPSQWLLNRSALTKRTLKGKRKNVRVTFKKILIPKHKRTAEMLGRWKDKSGKWQKKKSSQEMNSPGRYWVYHDVGTPKNKEKGYSPTKSRRYLKRAKKKVTPIAKSIFERKVQSALSKYR